jgi:hypothetical protein
MILVERLIESVPVCLMVGVVLNFHDRFLTRHSKGNMHTQYTKDERMVNMYS